MVFQSVRCITEQLAWRAILLVVAGACLGLVTTGCTLRFREVESNELEKAWLASNEDSAVSWWYLGEEGDFEYFVRKTPLKKEGYKIAVGGVRLTIERRPLTFRRDEWVNLKVGHLEFNLNSERQKGEGLQMHREEVR